MTPEGRVKNQLKKLLKRTRAYSHWPVLRGMGAPDLDCNLVYLGFAISIECKAPGEPFTPRQRLTAQEKREEGNCIVLGYRGEADDGDVIAVLDYLWDGKHLKAFNFACKQTQDKGFM